MEHIKRGLADRPVIQRLNQGCIVDQRAPGDVHQHSTGFHLCEELSIREAPRRIGQ